MVTVRVPAQRDLAGKDILAGRSIMAVCCWSRTHDEVNHQRQCNRCHEHTGLTFGAPDHTAALGWRPPGNAQANLNSPSMTGRNRVGTTGTTSASFEATPLIVGRPLTAHAVLLTGLRRPAQTGLGDFRGLADQSDLLDLERRRADVPDREEQLGVLF